MSDRRPVRDEDFLSLRNEDLVALVRNFDWPGPLYELLARCVKRVKIILPHYLNARHLAEDPNNATQIVLMASFKAIVTYNLDELQKPEPCHFESHLITIVKRRLHNTWRTWRRSESHRDPKARWDEELDRQARRGPEPGLFFLLSHKEQIDPARMVQQREFRARLHEAVGQFRGLQAFLWHEWEIGTPVSLSAEMAGISESEAWRVRRYLFAKLRVLLRNVGPEEV